MSLCSWCHNTTHTFLVVARPYKTYLQVFFSLQNNVRLKTESRKPTTIGERFYKRWLGNSFILDYQFSGLVAISLQVLQANFNSIDYDLTLKLILHP